MAVDEQAESGVTSVRLRPQFAAVLKEIADARGVTVSDLLREGAALVVCAAGACPCPSCPGRKTA